jgi:hypothetical protein
MPMSLPIRNPLNLARYGQIAGGEHPSYATCRREQITHRYMHFARSGKLSPVAAIFKVQFFFARPLLKCRYTCQQVGKKSSP